MRSIIRGVLLLTVLWNLPLTSNAAPLDIVTTLPAFSSLAKEVGGDRVNVHAVVRGGEDAHTIEPRPSDVVKVKRADLFVHSGLDYEPWRGPLVNAAGDPSKRAGGSREVDMSSGITLLEVPTAPVTRAEGDIHIFGNVHYTLDPRNAIIMAKTVAQALARIDPENAALYDSNRTRFVSRLENEIAEWRPLAANIKSLSLLAYHNEWVYLQGFLGFRTVGFLEPKPGIPPTARHLESVIHLIRQHSVRAIIQGAYSSTVASRSVAERAGGIPVIVLCQNVGDTPDCPDILSLYDYNIRRIASLL